MKKMTLILISVVSLLCIPVISHGEETLWDKAKSGVGTIVDKSKEVATDAVEWTGDKAKQGVEIVKESSDDAIEWTGDKAKQGWQATKETTKELINE